MAHRSAHMEFDQPGTNWHLMPSMMLWNSNNGGVRFPMSSGHLFMEGRYTASRYSQVSLMAGVTFLGR